MQAWGCFISNDLSGSRLCFIPFWTNGYSDCLLDRLISGDSDGKRSWLWRVSVKQMTGVWWVCVPMYVHRVGEGTKWRRFGEQEPPTVHSSVPVAHPDTAPCNACFWCLSAAVMELPGSMPCLYRAVVRNRGAVHKTSFPWATCRCCLGTVSDTPGQAAGWPATLSVLYLLSLDVCLVRDWLFLGNLTWATILFF